MTRRSGACEGLPLPDGCAVRLIDLDYGVGAMISVDEDGFVNIYLNARMDEAFQRRALQHELRHYYRDDLYSDAGIREIEAELPPVLAADGDGDGVILAMDGSPIRDPAPVFAPGEVRRIGRGLYLPEGGGLARAAGDLRALCGVLDAACYRYDVMQRPPLVPVSRLRAAYAGLDETPERAVAFVGWRPAGDGPRPALPVVLQFCLDDAEGAVYYDERGGVDSAVVLLHAAQAGRAFRVTVDARRRGGALEVRAIHREVDGGPSQRVY